MVTFCCVIHGNSRGDCGGCKKGGGVVESLVMKLDGWWGGGSSRTVQTVRTVIGSSRVFLCDVKMESRVLVFSFFFGSRVEAR